MYLFLFMLFSILGEQHNQKKGMCRGVFKSNIDVEAEHIAGPYALQRIDASIVDTFDYTHC